MIFKDDTGKFWRLVIVAAFIIIMGAVIGFILTHG